MPVEAEDRNNREVRSLLPSSAIARQFIRPIAQSHNRTWRWPPACQHAVVKPLMDLGPRFHPQRVPEVPSADADACGKVLSGW